MTLMSSISKLTTSVDQLAGEANVTKAQLDAKVAQAEAEIALAQAEHTATEVARGEAEARAIDAANNLAALKASMTYEGLGAILSEKEVNVTDLFVYDTSLDSDGGAWRKRCHHTSWYNEPLNTYTRGARREFPAVAVIAAAEGYGVLIFDGDDPNLPLWAKYGVNNPDHISVAALNGSMVVGNNYLGNSAYGGNGLYYYDFIGDRARIGFKNGSNPSIGPIETQKIVSGSFFETFDSFYPFSEARYYELVGYDVNDVAMTVLSDAPTDLSRGLPVPTIAIATGMNGSAGGVGSVIKHDGTVVDLIASAGAGGYMSNSVAFDRDGRLLMKHSWGGGSYGSLYVFDEIPNANEAYRFPSAREYSSGVIPRLVSFEAVSNSGRHFINEVVPVGDVIAIQTAAGENTTGRQGFTLLRESPNVSSNGMTAHICSEYNSGWMVGDIKLAALSDTKLSALDGTELVQDGSFVGTGEWNILVGATIENGQLVLADITSARAEQTGFSVEDGAAIEVNIEINAASTGTCRIEFKGANGWTINHPTALGAGGHSFIVGLPTHFSGGIRIIRTTGYMVVNSISVRSAAPNRFGVPLAVNGTIIRSPVAGGSDLVAYSNFGTGANNIEQAYNSALDFGLGDFSILVWLDRMEAWRSVVSRGFVDAVSFIIEGNGTANTMRISMGNTPRVRAMPWFNGVWRQLAFVRRNGVASLYLDGVQTDSWSALENVSVANAPLFVGKNTIFGSGYYSGQMSLLRISATAPTADQIRKIYEDERKLFQPGAQCILYGTSDAVTALAHDPKTNLLHVGTNQGRSVFDGLLRVANTETPVTTAISAVGGMIAEQ